MRDYSAGIFSLIVGPVSSGKSEEFIRRLDRRIIANIKVQVFKPATDTRDLGDGLNYVSSRNGKKIKAQTIDNGYHMLDLLDSDTRTIGIDEIQFITNDMLHIIPELVRDHDMEIIANGLDTDFRGEPFGIVPYLMTKAQVIDKIHGICVKCKRRPATMSQRLVDGIPAKWTDPLIIVGNEDYEPRCIKCHEVRV